MKNTFIIFLVLCCSFMRAQKLGIGRHVFGVQFIWDGYGSATIKKEGGVLKIEGLQYSKDKSDYCKIKGEIEIISDTEFKFKGTISTMLKSCCGEVEKTGEFTFLRTGKRKYWRLQHFEEFCESTCAYYIDLFQ